jgi:hypothetical protein
MTAPDFSGDTASIAADFTTRPSPVLPPTEPDFGPDVNGSQPFENIETGNAKPPRKGREPRPGRSALGSLGQNKKVRSPIRKLVEADKEKIANMYVFGGMALMPVRPQAAQVMAGSADACADAWYELAQENDTVRRVLLAVIEGGVWGKVFMAHMPILAALIPQHVLPPALRNTNIGQQLLDMMGMSVPDSPEETAD